MPLYDFHCEACDNTFEAVTPPGASAPCPQCGAAEARRVWSAPATSRTPGLRGAAASRSNATRRAREERRQEGFAKKREERRQQGG